MCVVNVFQCKGGKSDAAVAVNLIRGRLQQQGWGEVLQLHEWVNVCTIEQLIFKDIKLWGLSKIYFKQNILWINFEDEQAVFTFEDKYFWGSVQIHKFLKNLYPWK